MSQLAGWGEGGLKSTLPDLYARVHAHYNLPVAIILFKISRNEPCNAYNFPPQKGIYNFRAN